MLEEPLPGCVAFLWVLPGGAKPFAVIFTDIQSSTMLWGIDPEEMARCIQVHHEIIRPPPGRLEVTKVLLICIGLFPTYLR